MEPPRDFKRVESYERPLKPFDVRDVESVVDGLNFSLCHDMSTRFEVPLEEARKYLEYIGQWMCQFGAFIDGTHKTEEVIRRGNSGRSFDNDMLVNQEPHEPMAVDINTDIAPGYIKACPPSIFVTRVVVGYLCHEIASTKGWVPAEGSMVLHNIKGVMSNISAGWSIRLLLSVRMEDLDCGFPIPTMKDMPRLLDPDILITMAKDRA